MGIITLYDIIRDILVTLAKHDPSLPFLPEEFNPNTTLMELGLAPANLPAVFAELTARLEGREINPPAIAADKFDELAIKQWLYLILAQFQRTVSNPVVVYVDDEEENLFVFKRRFGKELNLKTFVDPYAALDYIRTDADVQLVITDEVMPKLSGNALCSEVRKARPFLKFILISGNPENDQDLVYNSLRHNRFFEFWPKPLDLERNGEEYLALIRALAERDEPVG